MEISRFKSIFEKGQHGSTKPCHQEHQPKADNTVKTSLIFQLSFLDNYTERNTPPVQSIRDRYYSTTDLSSRKLEITKLDSISIGHNNSSSILNFPQGAHHRFKLNTLSNRSLLGGKTDKLNNSAKQLDLKVEAVYGKLNELKHIYQKRKIQKQQILNEGNARRRLRRLNI